MLVVKTNPNNVDLPSYHKVGHINVFDEPFETTFIWWRDNQVAPICAVNGDFEISRATGFKMIVYAFADYIYRDEIVDFNNGTDRQCFYPLLGGRL